MLAIFVIVGADMEKNLFWNFDAVQKQNYF